MKWVKLHTSLPKNHVFRRLSPNARLVFVVSLCLAGDLNQNGALVLRDVGPMTIREIGDDCGLTESLAKKALNELVSMSFLSRRDDGAFVVERFEEKAGAKNDATNADRQSRFRGKKHNSNANSNGVTNEERNASNEKTPLPEEEVEEEVDRELPDSSGSQKKKTARKRAEKAPKEPAEWIAPLTASARQIGRVRFDALAIDQRNVVGRYHALKFMGFSRDETKNRKAGASLIAAIRDLGNDDTLGAITVGQYFLALQAVFDATGVLIRSPWAVRGALPAEFTAKPKPTLFAVPGGRVRDMLPVHGETA